MAKRFDINNFDTLDDLADFIEKEPIARSPRQQYEQVSPKFRQWFLDCLRGRLPEQQTNDKK